MDQLKEIEEIKQLKARYFRFLDTKNWFELGACLMENVVFSYPPQKIEVNGRVALIENFSTRHAKTKTAHTGSMPEILFNDNWHAEGIWFMSDYVVAFDENGETKVNHGFGHYHETYTCEHGKWKIQSILLERLLSTHPTATIENL